MTSFGISDQFSYPVQEFMLKNDTLKNGRSRIGLYGSAPRALFLGLILNFIIPIYLSLIEVWLAKISFQNYISGSRRVNRAFIQVNNR